MPSLAYNATSYLRPSRLFLARILRANERFAAQNSVDQYVMRALTIAIKMGKEKRKRGKMVNSLEKEDSEPQFLSLARVEAAKGLTSGNRDRRNYKVGRITKTEASATTRQVNKEEEKCVRVETVAKRRRLAAEAKVVVKAAVRRGESESSVVGLSRIVEPVGLQRARPARENERIS